MTKAVAGAQKVLGMLCIALAVQFIWRPVHRARATTYKSKKKKCKETDLFISCINSNLQSVLLKLLLFKFRSCFKNSACFLLQLFLPLPGWNLNIKVKIPRKKQLFKFPRIFFAKLLLWKYKFLAFYFFPHRVD